MAWQHYAGVANATTKLLSHGNQCFLRLPWASNFSYRVILFSRHGKLDLDKQPKEYLTHGAPRENDRERLRHGMCSAIRQDYQTGDGTTMN